MANGNGSAQTQATPRTARTAKPAPMFGSSNFAVSTDGRIVTIQFELGADLGPSSTGTTTIVSRGDSTWKAPDGTRFSFTAYRK